MQKNKKRIAEIMRIIEDLLEEDIRLNEKIHLLAEHLGYSIDRNFVPADEYVITKIPKER